MRLVLATFGSLGDLHPFLAIALALRELRVSAVIATHEHYRQRVEQLGLEFVPIRPNYDPTREDFNMLSMDPWRGTETILREGLFPHLRDTYEDLKEAVKDRDLLVSHATILPAPLLAEKTGIPWISVSLSPMSLMSVTDPPHTTPIPWLNKVWTLSPALNRLLMKIIRKETLRWCFPVLDLRRELNLRTDKHPLFEGQHSSLLSLALFSPIMGEPQPDWPQPNKQTGFCFLNDEREMPQDLDDFLNGGPPPVVFTLGSAAVLTAGDFFLESARAIEKVGCRAVFIAGKESRIPSSPDVFVTSYAPYSQVFGRAAMAVHQGGIGTTAQALRAGCPMLMVPFAHDQPDNAMRIVRLGVGRSIPKAKYTAASAGAAIRQMLTDTAMRTRAASVASRVAKEDGVDAACRAILGAASG